MCVRVPRQTVSKDQIKRKRYPLKNINHKYDITQDGTASTVYPYAASRRQKYTNQMNPFENAIKEWPWLN